MKKNLNPSTISNELKGSSAFFRNSAIQPPPIIPKQPEPIPHKANQQPLPVESAKNHATVIPRNHDTTVATTTPKESETIIEVTRKAVKKIGKEAATYRFTTEEKKMLGDVVYKYKRKGIRTSDNEITRISVNYLLEDYERLGEQSILAHVLALLNN